MLKRYKCVPQSDKLGDGGWRVMEESPSYRDGPPTVTVHPGPLKQRQDYGV